MRIEARNNVSENWLWKLKALKQALRDVDPEAYNDRAEQVIETIACSYYPDEFESISEQVRQHPAAKIQK